MTARSTPTLEQWRLELAPWLAALEHRLQVAVPPLPTPEDMANVWLSFEVLTVEDYAPAPWTLILEALELVDLLVRVDAATGWTLLLSVVQQNPAFAVNAAALFPRHRVLPRYKLAYIDSDEVRDSVATVFVALRRMIAADEDNDEQAIVPSPTFAGLKQRLLEQWKQQHDGQAFDRTRDGRIVIKPQMILSSSFQNQPVPFMVEHTFAMGRVSRMLLPPEQRVGFIPSVEADAERDDPETLERRRRDAVFCFVAVDFELIENPATNQVLFHLLNTSKEALPITELVLDQVVMPQLHFSVAGSFFLSVLGVYASPTNGLKRFEFSSGRFDRATVGAICSALALSNTIEEFAFTRSNSGVGNDDDDDHDEDPVVPRSVWWPWLAYALFSRDAANKIERAVLDVYDLTVDDVHAMRDVLTHPNPLAHVCALDEPAPQSPVLSTTPTDAMLRPRTRIAIGHRLVLAHEEGFVDRGTATVTTNAPYQIVRDNADEAFLEIVFPGSGVAWIDRTDVQEIRPRVRREATAVTSLELRAMTAASQPAVLELLRLVGGSLQSLKLWEVLDDLIEDDFMDAVCALCPQVTNLHVNGYLQSLRWLVAATSDRPCWTLERLRLPSYVADHASLLAFIQSLQDADHALSQSLRAIHFADPHSVRCLSGTQLQAFCAAWGDVLRKNWRLEQCEFLLRAGDDDAETIAAFKDRLRIHDGEPIAAPQKIAFFSVLVESPHCAAPDRKRHKAAVLATTVSARLRLPREAARLILDMAFIPSRRICG